MKKQTLMAILQAKPMTTETLRITTLLPANPPKTANPTSHPLVKENRSPVVNSRSPVNNHPVVKENLLQRNLLQSSLLQSNLEQDSQEQDNQDQRNQERLYHPVEEALVMEVVEIMVDNHNRDNHNRDRFWVQMVNLYQQMVSL
tara:strand:- start:17 stop:448 length:432 start_codon:yes stop_codon:yes gene_type:complete